jgi:phenylacetate-CoA ligase
VPAEALLIEVLDDDGQPVRPGRIGRIVVTMLHNYATPLIRYAIGDYAEAAEPCACGRGLPTLARIVGRERNMLIAPSGAAYWPSFNTRRLREVAPIAQMQFRQYATDRIEALFVLESPATAEQTAALTRHVEDVLPAGMRADVRYVDEIPRGANGKFETFLNALQR